MPLWENSSPYFFSGNMTSLQEHTILTKTLKDSLKDPKIHKTSKGASRFALLPGSLTVEAALVLPLFLFAMINILSLFLMFESYGTQLARLHQSGRQMAVLAHAQGTDTQKQDIELVSAEWVEPLIGMVGYRGCLVVNGCVMHKWIGYDLAGEALQERAEEEMVFITAQGSVYHTSRSCSYLNPAVETVSAENAAGMKNMDGKLYTPCQTCGGDSEMVYVTGDGERYHSSISCGGLKRTVDCVTKKRALELGRHVCSRCGG